ncbi:MAG: hypothetical protein AB1420_09445 [Bacillota bacterium]
MNLKINGFEATAIGSLPHKHPEQALELIGQYVPDIPHWPQLPNRGLKEHFVFQYLGMLVELGLIKINQNKFYFDCNDDGFENNLLKFYELYLDIENGSIKELENFTVHKDFAPGFHLFLEWIKAGRLNNAIAFKGQISGPLSVGLNLKDERGVPIYYNEQLKDLIVKTLMLQAWQQARELQTKGKRSIIFVDDPGIVAYGSSGYLTLDRQTIINDLSFIIKGIHTGGALAGAHSCAGIDWPILVEAGFDIISFDAYGYFQTLAVYKDEVKSFIDRGGILAWGIVPTYNLQDNESADNLKNLMTSQIDYLINKGVSEEKLLRQIIVTPACGAATVGVDQAEKIYHLLFEVSMAMRNLYGILAICQLGKSTLHLLRAQPREGLL